MAVVRRLEASLTGGTSDEASNAIQLEYVAVFWCTSNDRHAFVASPAN